MERCTTKSRRMHLFISLSLVLISSACAEQYRYLSYAQLQDRLTQLVNQYPNLVRMYSAQQTFLLPHVGNCTPLEQSQQNSTPCTIWVVELSNFETLSSNPYRPEILVSGLLHGDEIIGPHAVLAFLEYMLHNYHHDPFVKRMVDTRLVTLVPMTNAIGFNNRERIERQMEGNLTLKLDPNRDFGFNQQPTKCMQTVAARVLNELFRVHLFRVLITFHGGTNVIGYEWGDNYHCDGPVCNPAPDMKIMDALGKRMSFNAGPAGKYEAEYPVGDMGKLVYPVNGGLEDWAYGASWSGQGVVCTPSTLGGYPKERTAGDDSQKRCVTYLVETSREKRPEEHTLGSSDDITTRGAPGDGHVPRNVRLLLSAVDSVEPYVVLHDSIPTADNGRPRVTWSVGGAFFVDGSAIQWRTIDGTKSGLSDVVNGTAGVKAAGGEGGVFSMTIPGDFPTSKHPIYIRVAAVVDQAFTAQPNGSVPDITPQSHLMGCRASSTWSFATKEHKIEGQQVFFSNTKRITLSESGIFQMTDVTGVNWNASESPSTLTNDLVQGHNGKDSGDVDNPLQPRTGGGPNRPLTVFTGTAGVLVIVSIAIVLYIFVRRKRLERNRAEKNRSSFSLGDDYEEEERQALAPHDVEAGRTSEVTEQVLEASGLRT